MLALLKLIPLKDWLYCGIIVALLSAFGGYTVHERHIGEQKIEAADARAVAAQKAHVQVVQNTAQASINESVKTYTAAVAAPTAPAPRILCRAASGSAVPGHASSPGASDDRAVLPESTGPEFNPAEHALAVGKQADAQVTLLQSYVKACQAAGICAK